MRRASSAFGALVGSVGDSWSRPTPCDGWTVRDLVNHVVGGNVLFTQLLQGSPLPEGAGLSAVASTDFLGDDPVAAFDASVSGLLAAFEMPGVMAQTFPTPIGVVPGAVVVHLRVTEWLVHGWDLQTALGRLGSLPEDLAEEEIAISRAGIEALPPGRMPFAPPQPAGAEAPASDRLAALLGRDVGRR